MKRDRSLTVTLPCCGQAVRVTGRRSKQLERPRNHACPTCGRKYKVLAGKVPPLAVSA